jgi:hypothetical protein
MQAHELDAVFAQLRRAYTPAEKARLTRLLKDAQRERWLSPSACAVCNETERHSSL